jgi:hypothetical protein
VGNTRSVRWLWMLVLQSFSRAFIILQHRLNSKMLCLSYLMLTVTLALHKKSIVYLSSFEIGLHSVWHIDVSWYIDIFVCTNILGLTWALLAVGCCVGTYAMPRIHWCRDLNWPFQYIM